MSNVRYPLGMPANPLKRAMKVGVGQLLAWLFPARARALLDGVPMETLTRGDYWMLTALAHRAARRGEMHRLGPVFTEFWKSRAAEHFTPDVDDRYRELFLKHHAAIVTPLVEAARAAGCRHLVEIGCGNGDVLRHYARELPELASLTGLDLNGPLLATAQQRTDDARIAYHEGDARLLVREHTQAPAVVMSNGGVLEYLTEQELREMFGWLAKGRTAPVFALVEPLGSGHDLDRSTGSEPYGAEFSHSHHYPLLLTQAGYAIRFRQEVFTGPQRWILLVAALP